MGESMKRDVAIVIFVDQDRNIAVQERGSHSKSGAKYGFWGGRIEDGESKEKAMRRELIEELNYIPKKIHFWTKYSYIVDDLPEFMGLGIVLEVFISPITEELLKSDVKEGSSIVVMPIDEAINDEGFYSYDRKLLMKLEEELEEVINLF